MSSTPTLPELGQLVTKRLRYYTVVGATQSSSIQYAFHSHTKISSTSEIILIEDDLPDTSR
ncbi:hypothetical protein KSC_039590 [Ktedonobacter sp. SOSP1-52]|nr:hypothetical protein KSC_039590 [Ktedonobacter sp. SOSP1-52]